MAPNSVFIRRNLSNGGMEACMHIEAPVGRNPREAEKVSATGAGRLRDCVNNYRVCMS